MNQMRGKRPRLRLALKLIASSATKSWCETAGVANRAGEWRVFKSITSSRGAAWVTTPSRISWLFVLDADLTNIRRQGLIVEREIPHLETAPRRLVVLTKQGYRLRVSQALESILRRIKVGPNYR